MKSRYSMNNLPEDVKKHCERLLKQGVLPRSGKINEVDIEFPSLSKYKWKDWAVKNNVKLPDDFLDIAK